MFVLYRRMCSTTGAWARVSSLWGPGLTEDHPLHVYEWWRLSLDLASSVLTCCLKKQTKKKHLTVWKSVCFFPNMNLTFSPVSGGGIKAKYNWNVDLNASLIASAVASFPSDWCICSPPGRWAGASDQEDAVWHGPPTLWGIFWWVNISWLWQHSPVFSSQSHHRRYLLWHDEMPDHHII